MAPLTYAQAVGYLSSSGRFGIKLGLDRVRALLDAAGSPDTGLRGALVAGTNGKGSTCAFLVSVLHRAGYTVGSMPKPHLNSYTERVCVDGEPISEAEFASAMTTLLPTVEAVGADLGPATEFEMLTALAVRFLRDRGVDWLVCEVGMGGRLDATNVLDLGVKVITSIGLDHTQYLGEDLASIAAEKAGIIRPGDLVVVGDLPDAAAQVVAQAATDSRAAEVWWLGKEVRLDPAADGLCVTTPVRTVDGLRVPLLGRHQLDNAALAVGAADAIALRHGAAMEVDAVRRGIAAARWPGRLERIGAAPEVIVDGAHNPDAIRVAVTAVRDVAAARRPVVLFGAMTDKDVAAMLAALPPDWPAVFTAVSEARAMIPGQLLSAARDLGRRGDEAVDGVPEALTRARERAGSDGLVVTLGSLYLAGAARAALLEPVEFQR